jgi:hypothetical protein
MGEGGTNGGCGRAYTSREHVAFGRADAREQIQQLLRQANIEWMGMILLGLHAGLRLNDAANLTWEPHPELPAPEDRRSQTRQGAGYSYRSASRLGYLFGIAFGQRRS